MNVPAASFPMWLLIQLSVIEATHNVLTFGLSMFVDFKYWSCPCSLGLVLDSILLPGAVLERNLWETAILGCANGQINQLRIFVEFLSIWFSPTPNIDHVLFHEYIKLKFSFLALHSFRIRIYCPPAYSSIFMQESTAYSRWKGVSAGAHSAWR